MDMDRRGLLAGAGVLVAGSATAQTAPAAPVAAPACAPIVNTVADGTLTADYARFAASLSFDALPQPVVHAAGRALIDAIGCTLAGWESRKGRLAAACMEKLGGPAEAQVIGGKARVSVANASFANAELMNGLDYDAIPHIPPVVVPGVLAVAETRRSSGRDLLLATIISYEIAARLSAASSPMSSAILETGTTPEVFGINTEAIMATAAATARLAGLDAAHTAHAIGLAGYFCPPQASHDWETISPKTNVKYTQVGLINQAAVTAMLLAESGYTGNDRVLDGPAGFARFYGWTKWDTAAAARGLGDQWRILNADYKPYACCRYAHSRLDALIDVLKRDGIRPEAIESIHSYGPPFVANPDQMNVRTQEDAQFSVPYVLALAALGIPLDARCQREELLQSPQVKAMMQRIRWETHPRFVEAKRADPRSFIASVEVKAAGRVHKGEVLFARGNGVVPEARTTDAELDAKFLANAAIALPPARARQVLDMLHGLDKVADVSRLSALLSV